MSGGSGFVWSLYDTVMIPVYTATALKLGMGLVGWLDMRCHSLGGSVLLLEIFDAEVMIYG